MPSPLLARHRTLRSLPRNTDNETQRTDRHATQASQVSGRWQIDPGHTEVAFIGRHFMLTKVRGRFIGVTGTITVDDEPSESTAEVTIDMASVNSGSQARDDHLRSPDFFDVTRYPAAIFSGRAAGGRAHTGSWPGT